MPQRSVRISVDLLKLLFHDDDDDDDDDEDDDDTDKTAYILFPLSSLKLKLEISDVG